MDYRTFHKEFQEFEIEEGIFDDEIDGVPYWERIRFTVSRRLEQAVGTSGVPQTSSPQSTFRSIGKIVRAIFFNNPLFQSKSDYLFWGHERRKLREDGLWWDLFCDPVINAIERDYIYLERPYLHNHRQPAKTPQVTYTDLFYYSGDLRKLYGQYKVTISNEDIVRLKTITSRLEERFGVRVDLQQLVQQELADRRSMLPLYRLFLNRIRPKVVVLAKSNGRETLIEVCQILDIPVVELQHSMVHPHHYIYSFPGPERTKQHFPDYFLTFGEYWSDAVEFPIPNENVIAAGYPYFESERARYSDKDTHEQVLFISQGTAGEEISRFAAKFASMTNLDVIYKLHPGEYPRWESAYPWLRRSDLIVIDQDTPTLYELFSESTVQVGVSSTALFEGLGFSLDTYLISHPRIELMDSLIDSGFAEVVRTPQQLMEGLNHDGKSDYQYEQFFKSGGAENIIEILENIRNH